MQKSWPLHVQGTATTDWNIRISLNIRFQKLLWAPSSWASNEASGLPQPDNETLTQLFHAPTAFFPLHPPWKFSSLSVRLVASTFSFWTPVTMCVSHQFRGFRAGSKGDSSQIFPLVLSLRYFQNCTPGTINVANLSSKTHLHCKEYAGGDEHKLFCLINTNQSEKWNLKGNSDMSIKIDNFSPLLSSYDILTSEPSVKCLVVFISPLNIWTPWLSLGTWRQFTSLGRGDESFLIGSLESLDDIFTLTINVLE